MELTDKEIDNDSLNLYKEIYRIPLVTWVLLRLCVRFFKRSSWKKEPAQGKEKLLWVGWIEDLAGGRRSLRLSALGVKSERAALPLLFYLSQARYKHFFCALWKRYKNSLAASVHCLCLFHCLFLFLYLFFFVFFHLEMLVRCGLAAILMWFPTLGSNAHIHQQNCHRFFVLSFFFFVVFLCVFVSCICKYVSPVQRF